MSSTTARMVIKQLNNSNLGRQGGWELELWCVFLITALHIFAAVHLTPDDFVTVKICHLGIKWKFPKYFHKIMTVAGQRGMPRHNTVSSWNSASGFWRATTFTWLLLNTWMSVVFNFTEINFTVWVMCILLSGTPTKLNNETYWNNHFC